MEQLIPYRKKNKWGFCTPERQIVIDCTYQEVNPFSKMGKAEVKLNGEKEYIDKEGQILRKDTIVYDQLSSHKHNYVYFNADTLHFISPNNMPKSYAENNLAPIQRDNEINDNYGYINIKGELILPFIYQYADFFYEDLAHVVVQEGSGFINHVGEFVIHPNENRGYGKFSEDLAYMITEDGFGFINKNGEIVIPCRFVNPGNFSEGLAGVRLNKWGYINKGGMFVIPDIYDEVHDFKEGFGIVKLNNKYGYYNKDGELLIPCIYEGAESFEGGIAKVKLNDKWGYINARGVQYWED